MNMFKNSIRIFSILVILVLGFTACVDQEFDIPPGRDVQLEDISTTTIAELKANFTGGSSSYTIPEDVVIKGVVVSNDAAGNFFKTLVIQDETAGIHLSVDANDLNVNYPPGRTIYLKGGLELGQFAELVQIGISGSGSEVSRIPEPMFEEFAIIGELVDVPTPAIKTISELGVGDLSTLVQLNDVEYSASLIGQSYAVPNGGSTQNRIVLDCNGAEITVRNSDFADFAGVAIPEGNGTLVGVYSIFGTTKQFTIRDVEDVNFANDRCDGTTGGGGDQIAIADLREAFNNGATVAPTGFIEGVVISDVVSGNTLDQNLVIQDGDSGIAVRFTDGHTYELGSRIAVNVSGVSLEEFRGLLQLNNTPIVNSSFISASNSVVPNVVTIEELLADFDNLESTLVQLNNVELTGSNTFAGDLDVTDATSSLISFTRDDAAFANDLVPTGQVTFVGMVSEFTQDGGTFNPQVLMRNRSDVDGGGTGILPTLDLPAAIGFDSGIPSGWVVTNSTGARTWEGDDFGGEFFAEMSAFNSGDILDVVTWMITPEIDFDAQSGESVEIVVADAFRNGNPLEVFYSTDYSGTGNPSGATWTQIGASQIDPIINNPDTFDNNFESSGDIDISMVNGKGFLAFVYDSKGGTVSTNIQINQINIQ